ncbi:MAG: hypothetical protein KDA33_03415 [Phycisphaerales bacterium]|nr:hypothetical protein [Phycisphaerales bacterium]
MAGPRGGLFLCCTIVMDLLIQEPAPDTTRLASVACWFDPATREVGEIRAPAGAHRYMIWSADFSRGYEDDGAVWDLAPIWTGLGDRLYGESRVTDVAISRLGVGAQFRAMRVARLSQANGDYYRSLFDAAECVFTRPCSQSAPEADLLPPDWTFTVITSASSTLGASIEQLKDEDIGFAGLPERRLHLINRNFLTAMLDVGPVVLSVSDSRFAPFPMIYARQRIGDALVATLRSLYDAVDIMSDEAHWRAFS